MKRRSARIDGPCVDGGQLCNVRCTDQVYGPGTVAEGLSREDEERI